MPISILRSFIQQILPHSSTTQVNRHILLSIDMPLYSLIYHRLKVSIYDAHDQLLDDTVRVGSLKQATTSSTQCSPSSSPFHIPIRFTMINTITSIAHCTCLTASTLFSLPTKNDATVTSITQPNIIHKDSLRRALSTCTVPTPSITSTHSRSSLLSPCSSFSPPSSSSPTSTEPTNLIPIVNLLSPPVSSASSSSSPSCPSSLRIDQLVESVSKNPSIIDEITLQFGEICPPLTKKRRSRGTVKSRTTPSITMTDTSNQYPLDLTTKKRPIPSTFDSHPTQSKWIGT